MSLAEKANLRLYGTDAFAGTFRHACLAKCGQVMIVPDRCTPGAPERLEEGQIWGCGTCGALHEYYIAHRIEGGRGVSRQAAVRLLRGVQSRAAGEPTITEWVK